MRSPTRFWAVALLLASGLAACTDSTGPTSPQVTISVDDPVAAQRGNGADGEVIRLPLDVTVENIGSVRVWYRSSTGQRPPLYKDGESISGIRPVERQVPAELVRIQPGEQHTTSMQLGFASEEWEGPVTDDGYELAVQLLDKEEAPVQWPEGLSEAFRIELIEP